MPMPSGNPQNFKPMNMRTKEEQRKIASAGGKASGEARRRRKTLKAELLALLSDGDIQNQLSLAIITKALSGDVKAFEVIRDTIGEKPIEKIEERKTSITVDLGNLNDQD